MEPCPRAVDATQPGATGDAWEQRYREGRTAWDLGGPPPVLVRTIGRAQVDAGPWRLPPGAAVLVPGSGFGHDALAWARAGFRVTALDVAPSAVRGLADRAARTGLPVDVRLADFLDLSADLRGQFDVVWEQTCLCALDPGRRAAYVRSAAAALRPGGLYLGLFWNHGQAGGPPYDLAPETVRALFGPAFEEAALETVPDSPPGRSNEFTFAARTARPR
jgi:SAM-dependent methyltransferase